MLIAATHIPEKIFLAQGLRIRLAGHTDTERITTFFDQIKG